MTDSKETSSKVKRDRISLWDEPWWLDGKYPEWVGLSKTELQRRIEVVQSVMNDEWLDWLAKPGRTNAAIVAVRPKGASPLRQMLRIYDFIDKLSDSAGFEVKLREYLYSDYSKGRATGFELDTAYWLKSHGAEIVFPAEGKVKAPDIAGSYEGSKFTVECKFIQEQNWERELGNFMLRLSFSQRVRDSNPNKMKFRIDLDPSLTALTMPHNKPKSFDNQAFNDELFDRILDSIESKLCDELALNQSPAQFEEPGLYRIRILSDDDSAQPGVSGGAASLTQISRECSGLMI